MNHSITGFDETFEYTQLFKIYSEVLSTIQGLNFRVKKKLVIATQIFSLFLLLTLIKIKLTSCCLNTRFTNRVFPNNLFTPILQLPPEVFNRKQTSKRAP